MESEVKTTCTKWLLLAFAIGIVFIINACSPGGTGMYEAQNTPPSSNYGNLELENQSSTDSPKNSGGTRGNTSENTSTLPESPKSKTGKLHIEGSEETITLHLLDQPSFITYYPEDMIAVADNPERRETVRFIANFGGQRNDDAYMELHLFPEETDEAAALSQTEELAASYGHAVTRQQQHRYTESIAEFAGMADSMTVSLALGKHGDIFYYILIHHPAEYSDGFSPRSRLILEELRWKDTGESLE